MPPQLTVPGFLGHLIMNIAGPHDRLRLIGSLRGRAETGLILLQGWP
jgi:hypothetical protein